MKAIGDEQLIVVGTGIRATGQLTVETIAWVRSADRVLYIVSDPVAEQVFRSLNPSGAESLMDCYGESKPRAVTYREIVDRVLTCLRRGERVCFAAYGHPGVFAIPTHESVRRARSEGFRARMLPAVSAEDCLFADLGVDPFNGCLAFEATDFLVNTRPADPASHLVLWQIGGLGDVTYKAHDYDIRGLEQLARKLACVYGPNHTATLYEAPLFLGVEPRIHSGPLHLLPYGRPSPNSTLYIPPATHPQPDLAVRAELGLTG